MKNLKTALALSLIVVLLNNASALGCDPPTSRTDSKEVWRNQVTIAVNIDPAFDIYEYSEIQDAFINWQTPSGSIWSVTFSPFTSSSTSVKNVPGKYQVTKVSGNPCAGHTPPTTCRGRTGGTGNLITQRRSSAWTEIDDRVTDLTACNQLMVHEIGHSFALMDCTGCDNIMCEAIGMNDTNGFGAPTSCDVDVVNPWFSCPEWNDCVANSEDPDFCAYPISRCRPGYSRLTQDACCTPAGSPY